MIAGTILHIFVGLLIHRLTKWTPVMISALYFFKEIGEAKYRLSGTIWSIEKPLRMLWHVFEPGIALQWIAPGVAVYLVIVLQRKYDRNRRPEK